MVYLEALLHVLCNLAEIASILVGSVVLVHGFVVRESTCQLLGAEICLSTGKRIAIGIAIILLGLAFPSIVAWFIASARDAIQLFHKWSIFRHYCLINMNKFDELVALLSGSGLRNG